MNAGFLSGLYRRHYTAHRFKWLVFFLNIIFVKLQHLMSLHFHFLTVNIVSICISNVQLNVLMSSQMFFFSL